MAYATSHGFIDSYNDENNSQGKQKHINQFHNGQIYDFGVYKGNEGDQEQ